jgi:hypothetical protein
MDVFSLRETVVGEYKQFATSFTSREPLEEALRATAVAQYAFGRYGLDPRGGRTCPARLGAPSASGRSRYAIGCRRAWSEWCAL